MPILFFLVYFKNDDIYKNNNNFQGKYEKYKKLVFQKKKLNEAVDIEIKNQSCDRMTGSEKLNRDLKIESCKITLLILSILYE